MKEVKEKLSSVINYLIMHDDNKPNSEFCEKVDDLVTVLTALNIDLVSKSFCECGDQKEFDSKYCITCNEIESV